MGIGLGFFFLGGVVGVVEVVFGIVVAGVVGVGLVGEVILGGGVGFLVVVGL